MSNLAGKAYGMNMLSPMKPRRTWINEFLFMVSRAIPSTLRGLLGLSIIHFAKWAIIRRKDWPDLGQGKQDLQYDYLLFCSNFNGTWDQYIDAFSDGIPTGLNMFWYSSLEWPGSIPITAFKDYINHYQISTGYYYNATPGAAQRDIKSSLLVLQELRKLAASHDTNGDPAQFVTEYTAMMHKLQNRLGSQGAAPIASNETAAAERNRQEFVDAKWGAGKRSS